MGFSGFNRNSKFFDCFRWRFNCNGKFNNRSFNELLRGSNGVQFHLKSNLCSKVLRKLLLFFGTVSLSKLLTIENLIQEISF